MASRVRRGRWNSYWSQHPPSEPRRASSCCRSPGCASGGSRAATAVFLVLLAESALPFGFVLPGDTLLLTAGLTCATGHLSLWWTLVAAGAGAVAGAHGGYLLGRAGSRFVLPRPGNARIQRAVTRFELMSGRRGYGPALMAARFVPVARSVAAPLSGLLRVPAARFTVWQLVGGLVWVTVITLAGYGAGLADPALEHYAPLFLIVAALFLPLAAAGGYLVTRVRTHRRPAPPTVPPRYRRSTACGPRRAAPRSPGR
jgi:membrane-associated protein